jgi:hypothetical protein
MNKKYMNIIKNKNNFDRVDLDRVIGYRKGAQHYMTGFFGLGKTRINHTIHFKFEGNSESWSFKEESERDRAFEIIDGLMRPSEV